MKNPWFRPETSLLQKRDRFNSIANWPLNCFICPWFFMKCLITAGPTFEALDQVRRLTNFSTGTLGTGLAEHLVRCGHEVTLLLGEMASAQPSAKLDDIRRFTSTSNLRELLEELAGGNVSVVYHAAAVSDFRFGKVWERSSQGELREVKSGKISTGHGNLQAELIPTPKIIAELRSLFPQARLVGWKYEVEGNRLSAISKAKMERGLDSSATTT